MQVHLKAALFLREGQEMRFCQRCGRSHTLSEFNPGRHSCRAQLAKHNARSVPRQGQPWGHAELAARPEEHIMQSDFHVPESLQNSDPVSAWKSFVCVKLGTALRTKACECVSNPTCGPLTCSARVTAHPEATGLLRDVNLSANL